MPSVVVALPGWIGDDEGAASFKSRNSHPGAGLETGDGVGARGLGKPPEDERVAYTTVQKLVYRLEEKGALKKVKKIGNAQLFQPTFDQSQYRSRLVRDLLDLFGGSPRLLVSNLIENGALTLRDLKTLQGAARGDKDGHGPGAKRV